MAKEERDSEYEKSFGQLYKEAVVADVHLGLSETEIAPIDRRLK